MSYSHARLRKVLTIEHQTQQRESEFESCVAESNRVRILSLPQFTRCMGEYMAIDSGGYVFANNGRKCRIKIGMVFD